MSDELHYHRIKNLVKGLTDRSDDSEEAARLKWESIGPDKYEISLSRTSLRIVSEDPIDDSYPYKFSILNENGNEIETVYASSNAYDDFALRDLFAAASRNHRGVGEKLTEVFDELGIPDPPPRRQSPFDVRGGKKTVDVRDEEPPF